MKLVEINWNPTNRQLRQFGLLCLLVLPLITWYWGGNATAIAAAALMGAVLAGTGCFFPAFLKPIFLLLTAITIPIGIVLGELAMLCIFTFVFLPIGVIFRCLRRDALEPHAGSEWRNLLASESSTEERCQLLSAVVITLKQERNGSAVTSQRKTEFEEAGEEKQLSMLQEFGYLVENKKWWMIPILLVLALVGVLVMLGSTGAAPFIYTLF